MTKRFCIICGKEIQSSDPEAVFCPTHEGKSPATSHQETRLDAGPQRTIHQPDGPGETRFEGKGTLDAVQQKPRAIESPAQDLTDWQVGDVILDTYEVKGELGKGGFGMVYRAHHRGWNLDLAIKRALNLDEANKQDFVDEAQKWIDLGLHPHIISCYYVRNIDGFPHTFAELAEGGSLHDWIQGEKYDLYEGDKKEVLCRILDIAIQFTWGLDYAHQQGLVHQDVKPHNALMTPDGVLKVTDFGLAKAKGPTGAIPEGELGTDILVSGGGYTLAYRSPEQAQRKKLSQKTDIWSWSVSVLEMFNGGISWKAGDLAAYTLESYLGRAGGEGGIPPMPGAVAELLRGCFQKDPHARPRNILEIAERLVAIYQQETGQAYPRERPEPADLKADSLNNKALSMLDLGKPAKVEGLFEQAIEVDGKHVAATYNLGLLRWRSGLLADVDLLEQLGQIQQDKPEDANVASALGWVCMESGRFSEALAYFEQADRLGGDQTNGEGLELARPLAESGAGSCLRTIEGHTDSVTSIAISPDGQRALSGSKDKTLKLWDLQNGACLHTFEGHALRIYSVAISPDGRIALSGSDDETLKLWDLHNGVCLRTIEGHIGEVTSVAFCPDGHWALSGGRDNLLKLWDLHKGTCIRSFIGHTGWFGVNSIDISPDGYWALSGSADKSIKLWDLESGACLRTFEGHSDRVVSITFSPDGSLALSGSYKTLKLWVLTTGACLRTFEGHTGYVNSVAFRSDGRWALSGSGDETLKLWDLARSLCLRTFEGHKHNVNSVSFSPDGNYALSGGEDKTLKIWDLTWIEAYNYPAPMRYARGLEGSEATRREVTYTELMDQGHRLLAKSQIAKALMYLDRARAVPGFERASTTMALSASLGVKARIRGIREGWLANTFEGHTDDLDSVAISPDGRRALSGSWDNTIKLWDLPQGICLRTFVGHINWVRSVAFHPNGSWALSGSDDHTLKLWDLVTGACLRTFEGHNDWVRSVAFSPDGQWVLSGSADKTLKLWDLAGGSCLHTFVGHTNSVQSIAFSPDGRWALSGSEDSRLKLWDLVTGVCLCTFKGHTASVLSVVFSPDGHQAISGSGYEDNTLKLWDLVGGSCLCTFEGHTDGVTSVDFILDGCFVLSGSGDSTLKLWDVAGGACLRTFEGHTGWMSSVAISPDGRQAISGSADKTLKLWDLEWDYEFPGWADWDEGAHPYLETFLTLHTPYAGKLPLGRKPSEEELQLALTRQGKPAWTEADFQQLLKELGYCGYGWLREEGVRKKLEEMAKERG